ncbi:unnamed protein product [Heligmosomoides polygyrus]|uniref:Endo/exonuclease/phosphatase domain-containing protein n=1 Tax=Heligmosomoides polygyrus TaxID=6339 RepID=A0A183GC40_HELPZ|nr:unnamed protein product [Heligmosomoides polygyrus]
MRRCLAARKIDSHADHHAAPRGGASLSPCRKQNEGRTETIRRTDHNELLIIGAKVDRKNIGGVGFLVNSTVHHLVDSDKIASPRVAVLRLETKGQGTISIINGYAPTSAATDEEKEEFYKLFERTVNDEKSYYKVVVWDFNAIVDRKALSNGVNLDQFRKNRVFDKFASRTRKRSSLTSPKTGVSGSRQISSSNII